MIESAAYQLLLMEDQSSGGLPIQSQYQAVLDRMTALGFTKPSPGQQTLQNKMVYQLVNAGLWDAFDTFVFYHNDNNVDITRIDWKKPTRSTTYPRTPVFVPNQGVCFDPSVADNISYVQSGYTPSVDAVQYTQNAAGGYTANKSGYPANGSGFGNQDGATTKLYTYLLSNQSTSGINTIALNMTFTLNIFQGLYSMIRDGVNSIKFYTNTTLAASSTSHPSTGVPTVQIVYLGRLTPITGYSSSFLANSQPALFSAVGRNLSLAEITTLNSILDEYLANFGGNSLLTASGNYVVPDGVTQITVECIGGGGAGRGYTSATQTTTGGGGAGGGYSRSVINVTPGQIIPYTIGAGGAGTTAAGGNGGDTSWNAGQVLAKGGSGAGVAPAVAAIGGLASAGVGDVKFNGGNGGLGGSALANGTGGGGSGAGALQAGAAGLPAVNDNIYRQGPTVPCGAGSPGYTLGNGANSAGQAGYFGSGGSGARRTTGAPVGGAGGAGFIRVSYTKSY